MFFACQLFRIQNVTSIRMSCTFGLIYWQWQVCGQCLAGNLAILPWQSNIHGNNCIRSFLFAYFTSVFTLYKWAGAQKSELFHWIIKGIIVSWDFTLEYKVRNYQLFQIFANFMTEFQCNFFDDFRWFTLISHKVPVTGLRSLIIWGRN